MITLPPLLVIVTFEAIPVVFIRGESLSPPVALNIKACVPFVKFNKVFNPLTSNNALGLVPERFRGRQ